MICSVDILPPRLSIMTNRGTIEFQSLNKSYGIRISFENILYIEKLCAMSLPNETGGILIGQYSSDGLKLPTLQNRPLVLFNAAGPSLDQGKCCCLFLIVFGRKINITLVNGTFTHIHRLSLPQPIYKLCIVFQKKNIFIVLNLS